MRSSLAAANASSSDPQRRNTVGLDSPRDSTLDANGNANDENNNGNGQNNGNNKRSSKNSQSEFHVVPKRVVDACADLRVSLTRRLDIQHVIERFDEAKNRTILSNSNPSFIDSAASAGSAAGSPASKNNLTRYTATNFIKQQDPSSSASLENNNTNDAAFASSKSIAKKLAKLQYSRNVLISNASNSVTKEIFANVPEEWLKVGRAAAILLLYFVLFLVVPCSALQMDCTVISCKFNNASTVVNSTARDMYLHSVQVGDCPFEEWSNALFGIWFIVGSAAVFGVVVFIWTIADTFFHPFHAKFTSTKTRTVVATISSIPFRTRLFVVVPPLLGFGITGVMIFFRMRAEAENITWSWGTIAAPAIAGYGFALLLKMWISWKYFKAADNKDNTSANRNVLPANWAKLFLLLQALALTVAALVSPSIAAKMADCTADYGPHWLVVLAPIIAFFGVRILTSLAELFYRIANGNTSSRRNEVEALLKDNGSSVNDSSEQQNDDDDDDDDDNSGDKGTQSLNFDSDSKPVWQDFIRLLYRECCVAAGLVLVLMKLKYGYTIGWIEWKFITIPFLVSATLGFFSGIFELRASIRYASDQFCSLEDLLMSVNRGKTANSNEESLSHFGYGAAIVTNDGYDENEV